MTLQIGRALRQGAQRTVSVSGIAVLVMIFLHQLAFVGLWNTFVVNEIPGDLPTSEIGAIGFTLPLSTNATITLGLVVLAIGIGLTVVAIRLLGRKQPVLGSIPQSVFTRRIGRAYLSAVAVSLILALALLGSLLVGVALAVIVPFGVLFLLLFIIPSFFVGVSLQFAIFGVAIEDKRTLGALKRSWILTRGSRLRLFVLAIPIALLSGVGSTITSAILLADPLTGQLFSVGVYSLFYVFLIGTLVEAFFQLKNRSEYRNYDHSGTV